MSNHRRAGHVRNGQPVTVIAGWDRPLAYFFMVIEDADENLLYSNLDEADPASLTLGYFQRVLDRFGIADVSLRPGTTGLYEKIMEESQT